MKTILKSPLTYFLIAIILFVYLFGNNLYFYFKSLNQNDIEFPSIQALMAIIAGFINVVTIIFLYINYMQQKDLILNQNQDAEFNRVLDITYKQIDIANKDLLLNKDESIMVQRFEKSGTHYNVYFNPSGIIILNGFLKKLTKNINILDYALNSSELNNKRKYRIYYIINNNLYSNYKHLIDLNKKEIESNPEKFKEGSTLENKELIEMLEVFEYNMTKSSEV
ncbi:hypothetical protein [Sphingobacterium cellulitidis]|uniref:Uncharacterized protein n=1 Tax=Sphingobacterium cellulitidis TaxID=1768011 RepID=A0A8H9G3B1_9SPHI|nr:hypothetical protein [Sphingobacterium soli]MBA8985982.1 hypothetical protein [Sphingobacterium soli]GGE28125.1 hypothetical protein GCM10011516_27230 [Sphingobacterium soli]